MKKYIIVLLILIFSVPFLLIKSLYSQSHIKTWTKQYGTGPYDQGQSVALDSLGNIYITGYTQGNLDGNTNTGNSDIFISKYDSLGNKLWTIQTGTSTWDCAHGIAIDSSSNIYITGYTEGGLDGNANAGMKDIFLMKFDSSGNKQWTRQIGTINADVGSAVVVDSSSNIYITGYTFGNLDGNTNQGGGDIFVIKYDSLGNKLWTRQVGTGQTDLGNGITLDSSGDIYITGDTDGGLDGYSNLGYASDILLIKYDSSGNKQWTKQFGTNGDDAGFDVTVDSSKNIYITGWVSGNFDGNTAIGSGDIFIAKYNSAGIKQWTRQIGTINEDQGYGISLDYLGGVYITGYTRGNLGGKINDNTFDVFLAKYDSSGNQKWIDQFGTTGADFATGITIDLSLNIYIVGSTFGNLDGNISKGSYDITLVKYSPAGTISGKTTKADGITPLSGIIIEALQNNSTKDSKQSDLYGNFRMILSTGVYDIIASIGNCRDVRFNIPVIYETTTTVNFSFDYGILSGKVTKNDGITPLPGTKIEVLQNDIVKSSATANFSGIYNIILSTGVYDIRASTASYQAKMQTSLSIFSDSTTIVNFSLQQADIMGYVKTSEGIGISSVSMILSGTSSQTAFTDLNGSYKFIYVSSGSYIITPEKTSWVFSPPNMVIVFSTNQITLDFIGTNITPPVISNVGAVTPSATSVTITWTTNEPATSQVEYGTSTNYGTTTVIDPILVESHCVEICGLTNTVFHWRVRSKDQNGNEAISMDYTFSCCPSLNNQDINTTKPAETHFGPASAVKKKVKELKEKKDNSQ